ncbi:ROK family protein, partial [candidate division KSB1 bacterium]|nr:ROK family protein [candidate division KSB1 bacterium]NIR70498.1 ROK family protein [candidate division KSB1 bacterium]NIS27673.1 ROK family protein [candidate division KSB1 bacterium]NIT74508.1 ROK family protein [candidate division KSB1 bacterium]NIU23747.1 ROK family protein [candidate division KSB1 bacterium]
HSNLKSIGLSIPGIVDTKKGLVVIAPDLQWKNFDIRKIVHEVDPKSRNGRVIMDNEANSSALAEQWFGKDMVKNKSNIVFISEGIGTGIILNRELIQGSYDGAGQLGHMTIDPDGELCICGNHGCWELYTSKEKTVERFRGEDFDGNVNGELGKIIALALNGDERATKALRETGRYLGIGISNIIKAIDPEVVVLGGMIAQAWDIIRDDISEEIGDRVFFDIKKKNAQVVPTSLVERSSLIGAFTLVIREIFRGYRITK